MFGWSTYSIDWHRVFKNKTIKSHIKANKSRNKWFSENGKCMWFLKLCLIWLPKIVKICLCNFELKFVKFSSFLKPAKTGNFSLKMLSLLLFYTMHKWSKVTLDFVFPVLCFLCDVTHGRNPTESWHAHCLVLPVWLLFSLVRHWKNVPFSRMWRHKWLLIYDRRSTLRTLHKVNSVGDTYLYGLLTGYNCVNATLRTLSGYECVRCFLRTGIYFILFYCERLTHGVQN